MVSCYDSFNSITPDALSSEPPNATIEHLHSLYSGGTREINQDVIVEGVVTANDEHENFYKSIIIEESGYAIEVLDGLYNSYVRHPIGSRISLKLNGLGLDRYMGILRTGLIAPATSSYSLDYMSAEAVVDCYLTVIEFSGEASTPQSRTIEELSEDRAGELITIESLKLYTEDGIERVWSGYAMFEDSEQNYVWCYTSPYADFANEKIPQGELTLSGILQFGSTDTQSDQFIIKLRGAEDCIY